MVLWPSLKTQIQDYFRPGGFLCRTQYELASIKQTGHVTSYIDAFKCICSKAQSIPDNDILDYFLYGF